MDLTSGLLCFSGLACGTSLSALFLQVFRRGRQSENEEVRFVNIPNIPRGDDFVRKKTRRRVVVDDDDDDGAWGIDSPQAATQEIRRKGVSTVTKSRNERFDPTLIRAGWEGFSMEEVREHVQKASSQAKDLSASDVLAELQRGNTRFWMGTASRPEKSVFERRALIAQQYPTVAILGCADSRVPAEIIFDQGLGDMFVVRVAGNCADTTTIGSLEYAANHLKVKVIVVLGHEGCGAVKAAMLPTKTIEQEPPCLCRALKLIKVGLEEDRVNCVYDMRARDREAVVTNIRQQVKRLMKDPSIGPKVKEGGLIVVGAFYEISSGIVDFFMEPEEAMSFPECVTPTRGSLTESEIGFGFIPEGGN